MSERYIDLVLSGDALWTDIDEWVERWHSSDSAEPLHEYLGLDWNDYSLWVEQPNSLRLIIAARKREQPVTELLEHVEDHAMAARGGLSVKEARTVREWLEKTGRLPSH